ncbi:hypothetical protein B484DRAFT_399509 [Ochromonadaceae sp. CCMP2298]|nr:hypothetical protein B484DRAFT_399509 [Ochromonadaceae sp. CCMP2298]
MFQCFGTAACTVWKIDVKGAYTLQDYGIDDLVSAEEMVKKRKSEGEASTAAAAIPKIPKFVTAKCDGYVDTGFDAPIDPWLKAEEWETQEGKGKKRTMIVSDMSNFHITGERVNAKLIGELLSTI